MTDDDFRLEAQLDRARAERDALRAEVEKVKKERDFIMANTNVALATAREDAFEEAAIEASEHMAHACRAAGMTAGECIAKSIRALKKTTKGGGA